jgi:hypothetical protein
MELDNATNLDRKFGVPGTMMIGFRCFLKWEQRHLLSRRYAKIDGGSPPGLFRPTYAGANVGHPLLLTTQPWR